MAGCYYNDSDRFSAAWLRALIAVGALPAGDVDDRRIEDVEAADVRPYRSCHFFAGIGGWPLALQWVGWPDDRPVWTGSCPCQPFSGAGQRRGHADERHVWPAFHALISECSPPVVFGEQVASKDGREWLAAVRADLEHLGYACGAADLPAASVGAPHIRQRLFWVAHSDGAGHAPLQRGKPPEVHRDGPSRRAFSRSECGGTDGGLADAERGAAERYGHEVAIAAGSDQGAGGKRQRLWPDDWHGGVLVPCADGKARPAPHPQSGIHPLAHGVPGRVGRLRGYGNAIVPQVGAVFIRAYLDALQP